MKNKKLRNLKNGQQFYTSNNCSACPICETERKPTDVLFSLFISQHEIPNL